MDAGATKVEVILEDGGVKKLTVKFCASDEQVKDNGKGIAPEDFEFCGKRHYTSKIEELDDLNYVLTYGFRGEAVSSLCNLSNEFQVITRTPKDQSATLLNIDPQGNLLGYANILLTVQELSQWQEKLELQSFRKAFSPHFLFVWNN